MKNCKILNFCMAWVMFILISCNGYAVQKMDSNRILADNLDWRNVYMGYELDEGLVEAMAYKIDNLRIDVYLGLWCSDSKNNVPPFIKIINGIERYNVNIPVAYYPVERKPNAETQYYVEEFKVERVPTFIFYKKDKEIGRITENPKNSMIVDIIDIIM